MTADLTIGADVIYEPQLCPALMDTIKRASRRAVLVQNVARAGTEDFRRLCQEECSTFESSPVSFAEFEGRFPTANGWLNSFPMTDGKNGVYEVWHLTFERQD